MVGLGQLAFAAGDFFGFALRLVPAAAAADF